MATDAGASPVPAEASRSVRLVVGLGSSAGGLEALQAVVGQLTPNSGAAYVVAQHLAPDHDSLIVDLLAGLTPLEVVSAEDHTVLLPDTVYVSPPNRDIVVDGTHVRLFEPAPRIAPSPGIDVLFTSLAEYWPGRSVAVVLSGTGSDGSEGLRLVRATGSLTIAQLPDTARFDAMPKAAVLHGGADLVLSPEAIGRRLSSLSGDPTSWTGDTLKDPDDAVIATLANALRRSVGIDFAQYKESTIRRQVRRRMAVRQALTVADYVSMLSADIGEAHALARNLLVTVTSFFRDPEAFAALAREVKAWVGQRPEHEQLRVWVPGCATGEEVYSIAMVCSEALGRPRDLERHLKVFGTDLDEASLAVARRGLYRSTSLASIPEPYRTRYLDDGPNGAEVSAGLRSCVVFARHNVAENPPFPRIDLVSCRNTLIYFTVALQEQVLQLIAYALAPGGLLFLGNAEAIGAGAAHFVPLDASSRIFVRSDGAPTGLAAQRSIRAPRAVSTGPGPRRGVPVEDEQASLPADLLSALLRTVLQPSLVLDEQRNLVEVVGDVSPFCRVPEGRLPSTAGSFVRQELQEEALAVSLLARTGDAPIAGRSIRLSDIDSSVHVVARPLDLGGRSLVVLSFVVDGAEAEVIDAVSDDRQRRAERELVRLERELLASHESLRTSKAALQAVNEELEASSEELQASSEELQSSIEELEASNEELEASNEELGGLNSELRQRNAEQDVLNADLENIQSSLSQGMVMVDTEARITRFTPLAVRVFALVDTDIGAPLSTVSLSVPIPDLSTAVEEVLDGQPLRSLEALGASHSYVVQVAPYIDVRGARRGAIITLTDVTEMAELRATADGLVSEFTTVTDALEEVVWKRSLDFGTVQFASSRLLDIVGWSADEVVADPDLLERCIDDEAAARVRTARAGGSPGWVVEYPVTTRDGRARWLRESAVVVPESRHTDGYVVGTLTDVTDRVAVEARAADLSLTFEAVFDTDLFGVAVLDDTEHVVMANAAFRALVGYDASSLAGMPMAAFARDGVASKISNDHPGNVVAFEDSVTGGTQQLVHRDGTVRSVTVDLRRFPRPVGGAHSMAIVQDVTALTDSVERLARQAHFDDAVTGLLNRASFAVALERDIDRCARQNDTLALLWLDLDRFKEINDQHGHDAGDTVLRIAAERLLETVRGSDAVGRLGGDEFGIIVEGMARVAALPPLLARVLAALREPIAVGDATVSIAGSIGVAIYPDDGVTANDLMRAADAAMYAAKNRGGDASSTFTNEMSVAAEHRRAMRVAIDAAIAQQHFELYYQPIVTTGDRSLWGVEALLRWHSEGEVVSASRFISFTEDSGQIRELGPLTFALLRRDLERLRDAGHPELLVSVNMSVSQLEDHTLTDQLALWPMASGLAGLVVEVVESVFLPGNTRALEALEVLIGHGAEISIDDFGSGFSNLLLLETLSPAYVKLDRSMLMVGSAPARGRALVRCAVELAHALGARAVVEGVEDSVQWDLATTLGADLVQGYHVARPMSLTELMPWLVGSRRDVS